MKRTLLSGENQVIPVGRLLFSQVAVAPFAAGFDVPDKAFGFRAGCRERAL